MQIPLSLLIFYITLLINTYFSVKLFSKVIKPKDIANTTIDSVLVLLYIALAWFLNDVKIFMMIVMILFAIATLKYVSMIVQNKYSEFKKTLRNKIVLDSIGFFYAATLFASVYFINPNISAWILSVGFVIANIYLLKIKPFYKIYD